MSKRKTAQEFAKCVEDFFKVSGVNRNTYSLMETAKANGMDPFDYLNNVFTNLPQAQTENDFLNPGKYNI
jgi:hypothetical protein